MKHSTSLVKNPSSTSSDCRGGLLPRHTVTTDDASAAANDDRGSRSKTEQDAAADSSTDGESFSAAVFAAATAGSSRTRVFPANRTPHTTSTTQQSNDRAGAASRSALTVRRSLESIDYCLGLGGGVAPTTTPSCWSLTSVSLILAPVDGEIKARRFCTRRKSQARCATPGTQTPKLEQRG
jgi:hypothetical protein